MIDDSIIHKPYEYSIFDDSIIHKPYDYSIFDDQPRKEMQKELFLLRDVVDVGKTSYQDRQ